MQRGPGRYPRPDPRSAGAWCLVDVADGGPGTSEREALEEIAGLATAVSRRRRRTGQRPRRGGLVVAADRRRRVEPVVHRGERGQPVDTLDELEDRAEVVCRALEVAGLRPRRDHPGRDPDAEPER